MPPIEPGPSTFVRMCWALTILGALVGAVVLVMALFERGSLATVAVGCAVIPYVLAKSFSEMRRG